MSMRDWTREARMSLARLPGLTGARVPDAPSVGVRDLWPGDTGRGARLMKGELVFGGAVAPLVPGRSPGAWIDPGLPPLLRAHAHGHSWLRDLRALGTDGARLRARALVSDWLARPPADPLARAPHVAASRAAAWLAHYDFFAASADDGYRQRLMSRLLVEGRMLAAAIPTPTHDHRALVCLKGLLACAVAMPEQAGFLSRVMRHLGPEIGRQVLTDGSHAERAPAAQLAALRELTEMRALMQIGQIGQPLALAAALDRMSPVLRALRHGDGGLALFNGSQENAAAHVDLVLSQATRGRGIAAEMPDGGFVRVQSGRLLLLVDAGPPPPPGFDADAHAGTLSFELSVGRERLIVNCGAGILPDWRDALRATAAHSTLVVADTSSSELRGGGGGVARRPAHVTVDHRQAAGAHWLDLGQDGYLPTFGAVHHRRIYIADGGEDVRGEDTLSGGASSPFALRFHLHPAVRVAREPAPTPDEEGGSVLLTLPSGATWRLRADSGRLGLDESIYLGGDSPRRGTQIVVAVAGRPDADGDASKPDARVIVRWALSKAAEP